MRRTIITVVLLILIALGVFTWRTYQSVTLDGVTPTPQASSPAPTLAISALPAAAQSSIASAVQPLDASSNTDPNLRKCLTEKNKIIYQDSPCKQGTREMPIGIESNALPTGIAKSEVKKHSH